MMTQLTVKTNELEQALQQEPSTSYWLKAQLKQTKERDIVDALNDAELLVLALKTRLTLLTQSQRYQP